MNIDELKDKVSIYEVLEYYGLDSYGHTGHGWGNWEKVHCPFHFDQHASASVNFDKGRFHCFVCDVRGDILDIVQVMEHIDNIPEAMRWIETTFIE